MVPHDGVRKVRAGVGQVCGVRCACGHRTVAEAAFQARHPELGPSSEESGSSKRSGSPPTSSILTSYRCSTRGRELIPFFPVIPLRGGRLAPRETQSRESNCRLLTRLGCLAPEGMSSRQVEERRTRIRESVSSRPALTNIGRGLKTMRYHTCVESWTLWVSG